MVVHVDVKGGFMKQILFALFLSFGSTSTLQAATLQAVQFDQDSQQLLITVSYQGGLKPHSFSLLWDACQVVHGAQEIAARLIDSGWDDTGTSEISQQLSFDLSAQTCKPAMLHLFSDRHSRASVWIE